jgi:hypothetical protein
VAAVITEAPFGINRSDRVNALFLAVGDAHYSPNKGFGISEKPTAMQILMSN